MTTAALLSFLVFDVHTTAVFCPPKLSLIAPVLTAYVAATCLAISVSRPLHTVLPV